MHSPSSLLKYGIPLALCSLVVCISGFLPVLWARTARPDPIGKTAWVITVTLTAQSDPTQDMATYDFAPLAHDAKCSDDDYPDTNDLCVDEGDTVSWIVKTSTKNAHFVVLQHDSILDDGSASHKHKKRIENDDGVATTPLTVSQNTAGDSYDYCIAAYDSKAPHFYVSDPKMIIGGGRVSSIKIAKKIERDAKTLAHRAGPKQKQGAEQDLNKLLQALTDLKHRLNLE